MDVSLESKSLPSIGYSRKSYLQTTSQRLARDKLVNLHGRRSLALPSVGPDAHKGLRNHFAAKGYSRRAAKLAFILRFSASNLSHILGNFKRNSIALCKMAVKSFRNKRLFDHQSYPRLRRVLWNPWQSNGKLKFMKNQALELHSPFPKSFKVCKERTTERGKQSEENRGQQLQSSFALLEQFPKSIFYILYVIYKLRKSTIQCFKCVVDFLLKLPDICDKLEAENLKMKDNFAALREYPFAANQSFSEDFSSEDERLGSLSLGVKITGRHPLVISCELVTGNPRLKITLNGAPAGHESAETPIGHESNGAVAGDRTPNQMVSLPLPLLGTNQMAPLPGMVPLYSDITFSEHEGKDSSYGKEIGRPRNEEYARSASISQTPLQAMPCAICLSYEHLGEECPTIPAVREMFGDCNTYNSNWRDHPKFSWKPQPPQYKQDVQALPQASSLEQAMVNLSKVVGDFVGAQKSINAQLNQRIDSVESSLIKRMDEVQNDLSQKIDNLQDSISRFANLNTMQEKENSPSQPYQNSMSIHEMETKEGEPSQKREVKEVITLRSGKEVDLPHAS
ncbi:hypothetical protein CK203_103467 [Vitis vinifera]|uniref:Uncharacterized protein n=1 Tax=Vitis vinifera TaxID=29760 RepID=A0A438BL39_VITVI|nr:hypothetical protein CK203_103467 [Vitis vinifera]